MAYLDEQKAKFDNLKVSLEFQNLDQLRRKANGGNSILFTYKPNEEVLYINRAKELFPDEKYKFIDIAQLLVKFIDMDGWDDFQQYYKDFSVTPHIIFNSKGEDYDLMRLIISEIEDADKNNLTPILIRTGALIGTGIENANIMEHNTIMTLKHPLIFFYPSNLEGDNLYFLNFRLASKYRCKVIE